VSDFLTPRELLALRDSLRIGLLTALFSTVLGFICSIGIINLRNSLQKMMLVLFLTVLLISPFFHGMIWLNLLRFLIRYGVLDFSHLAILRSITGIIFVTTIAYTPLVVLIMRNALLGIPAQILDSARLHLKSPAIFLQIVIPILRPSLVTSFILVFLLSFNTFDVPAFFEKNTYITEIFSQFSAHFDFNRAFYLSAVPVLITFIGIWLLNTLVIKNKPVFFQRTQKMNSVIPAPKKLTAFSTVILFSVIIVSLIIPLISIVLHSGLSSNRFFLDIMESRSVIQNTVIIGLIGTVPLLMSGALGLLYKRLPILRVVALSTMSLPAITFGVFSIYVFNQAHLNFLYSSPLILLLLYTLRFAPILAELIYSRLESIPQNEINSGRLYLQSKADRFVSILTPYFVPTLIIGFGISMWLIVTELPITLLLQPAGFQSITTRLYILLHYGSEELMNSLTVVLLAVAAIPFIIVSQLTKQKHG
jgi:ABC-type Fe3+ transport system permease subunit